LKFSVKPPTNAYLKLLKYYNTILIVDPYKREHPSESAIAGCSGNSRGKQKRWKHPHIRPK